MNYFLFNNHILFSDGSKLSSLEKTNTVLSSRGPARACVLDVDLMIASSVEEPIEKKDSILVRKFNEIYQHEAYLIQDERIDHHLFQVMGIKEQKIREIYSLISPDSIEVLVPYGLALRQCLVANQIDLDQSIVFIEELGEERFLTVFDGLIFSRTRIISSQEDILAEIKRSQMDFFKKNEEFLKKRNTGFIVLTNNRSLVLEILKKDKNVHVEYVDIQYPVFEGLKNLDNSIKYRLPEEIRQQRKSDEFKRNLSTVSLSLSILAAGFFFLLISKIELGLVSLNYHSASVIQHQLTEELDHLDRQIYHEDLNQYKSLNYGIFYLHLLNLIPSDYQVDAFKFSKSKGWKLEVLLSSNTQGPYDPIARVNILKYADIKDIFVNNQPGKRITVLL